MHGITDGGGGGVRILCKLPSRNPLICLAFDCRPNDVATYSRRKDPNCGAGCGGRDRMWRKIARNGPITLQNGTSLIYYVGGCVRPRPLLHPN